MRGRGGAEGEGVEWKGKGWSRRGGGGRGGGGVEEEGVEWKERGWSRSGVDVLSSPCIHKFYRPPLTNKGVSVSQSVTGYYPVEFSISQTTLPKLNKLWLARINIQTILVSCKD